MTLRIESGVVQAARTRRGAVPAFNARSHLELFHVLGYNI